MHSKTTFQNQRPCHQKPRINNTAVLPTPPLWLLIDSLANPQIFLLLFPHSSHYKVPSHLLNPTKHFETLSFLLSCSPLRVKMAASVPTFGAVNMAPVLCICQIKLFKLWCHCYNMFCFTYNNAGLVHVFSSFSLP